MGKNRLKNRLELTRQLMAELMAFKHIQVKHLGTKSWNTIFEQPFILTRFFSLV